MSLFVEVVRTVTLWLQLVHRRGTARRLVRAFPPAPPLLGPIGWITGLGTALVALALFVPQEAIAGSSPVQADIPCPMFHSSPMVLRTGPSPGVRLSIAPRARVRAAISWRGGSAACRTPCSVVVPFGRRISVVLPKMHRAEDFIALGPRTLSFDE